MTRIASLVPALLLAAAALPVAAQPTGALAESIGTWRLTCATDRMTDRTACTLLHQRPAERSEPGSPALALEIVDHGGHLVPAVTARDLTLEGAARGLLALHEGRPTEATELLEEAAAAERALGYRFDAATVELDLARALEASGDATRAGEVRSEAEAFLASIGCVNAL
jgi:hypothetical protein